MPQNWGNIEQKAMRRLLKQRATGGYSFCWADGTCSTDRHMSNNVTETNAKLDEATELKYRTMLDEGVFVHPSSLPLYVDLALWEL